MKNALQKLEQIAAKGELLVAKDLEQRGIPREYLSRMARRGELARVSRGVYMLAEAPNSDNHNLAVVSKRYPDVVICLLSAARFHSLIAKRPREVWVAVPSNHARPETSPPPIRPHTFSKKAMTAGVEKHRIEGVTVTVYNVPKTICDLFKFRNKIGVSPAKEALSEALRLKKTTVKEIARYAVFDRMTKVMEQYLPA